MNSAFNSLLQEIRENSSNIVEQGRRFEEIAMIYFQHDRTQQGQFSEVKRYADWAAQRGLPGQDTGIDLVARCRHKDGWCAVQAKFYSPDAQIQKSDVDSFLASSEREEFVQRVLVDTTERELSTNVQRQIDQTIKTRPTTRVTLHQLAESSIDWSSVLRRDAVASQRPRKSPRPHQIEAIEKTLKGFGSGDRGQLIMACGTGKTYTGLEIAQKQVGSGGSALVLVPSLALMSQTISEWTQDARIPLRSFAVCSDIHVGRRRGGSASDEIRLETQDLVLPATTDAGRLAEGMSNNQPDDGCMDVVFGTYQSLAVIEAAQKEHGLGEFGLIICDEAHRTTGQIKADKEASSFVIVHDQSRIQGRKRLYMTATPRIYSEGAARKAVEGAVELCSMDDQERFGPVFHYQGFASAVADDLLTDYKVIVLVLDEAEVSEAVKDVLANQGNEVNLDDATKIVGCYKALMKEGDDPQFSEDPDPSTRALAFCNTIKNSERIANLFPQVVEEYLQRRTHFLEGAQVTRCELSHVDGTMNAKQRMSLLEWLAGESSSCRVLSNVRCLGEGVDVPALDAILFLHPRKSQVDVVQSVGRVMRRSPGKKLGYVVLPIGIPPGVEPEQALDDNEAYKAVWQVLNALRSHDERLGAELMRSQLGEDEGLGDRIKVVYANLAETALVESVDVDRPSDPDALDTPIGTGSGWEDTDTAVAAHEQREIALKHALTESIKAKIVQKCGVAYYWSDWAEDVAKIASRHVTRIDTVLGQSQEAREKFEQFVAELRDDLNPSVKDEEAVQMLAQHLITRPVFEALFQGSSFTRENSVSQAMQSVVDVLDQHGLEKEAVGLEDFYNSVRWRAEQVITSAGRQNLIRQLYEKFFQKAFKQLTQRLGIVFTPVELVDYILRSVDAVLKREFDCSISSEGVHVLDPFTGTGTFLARLMELDLIAGEDLPRKYRSELHANEIVPLAYYIAGINIEQAYHERMGNDAYEAFDGLCLTDTFQQSERSGGSRLAELFPQNDRRLERLSKLDIKVIVGNPPYSAGQRSANDNAANLKYPALDSRIENTYALKSTAANKNSLYDSYIRAIRWASDRIGERGVIGFVTNAGFLESNSADGLRACLAEEFSSLYVLNLRGNARTSGELRRKEKDNVFEQGSRAPISVTLFVKNPDAAEKGKILYHDIGDYLSREEKLAKALGFAEGKVDVPWVCVEPDQYGDWINKRDPAFNGFIALGDKKDIENQTVFQVYSRGLETARDAWCWNFSKSRLEANIKKTIEFYNKEVERISASPSGYRPNDLNSLVEYDLSSVSWSSSFFQDLVRSKRKQYEEHCMRIGTYRPFTKQNLYFSNQLNHRVSQFPRIFPSSEVENRVICVRGLGTSVWFSVLMCDTIPDLNLMSGGAQCFPKYFYEEPKSNSVLSTSLEGLLTRRDAISDETLGRFANAYPGLSVTKDDIFHYVYGLLHSQDYQSRYANNLYRSLPRIPLVQDEEDFVSFVIAGQRLGELHIGYESVTMHSALINGKADGMEELSENDLRVSKMRFGKRGKDTDKSIIQYNERVRVSEIPLEAYQYIVNGKSAIEWIMERQVVTFNKDSGIVNDANDFAKKIKDAPAYSLKLLLRTITVSLQSQRIVRSLPLLNLQTVDG